MQTPNLQLPTLNATAVTAPKTNVNLGANDNDAFKQALSREMNQRQSSNNTAAKAPERPAASRSSAPKPAEAAKPAQPQRQTDNTDQASQATQAQAGASASGANKTGSGDSDTSGASDSATSDAQAAQSTDPVADMLALVAAFNQPAATTSDSGADAVLAGAGGATGAADAAALAAANAALKAADAAALDASTAAAAEAAAGTDMADAELTDATALPAGFSAADLKAALDNAAAGKQASQPTLADAAAQAVAAANSRERLAAIPSASRDGVEDKAFGDTPALGDSKPVAGLADADGKSSAALSADTAADAASAKADLTARSDAASFSAQHLAAGQRQSDAAGALTARGTEAAQALKETAAAPIAPTATAALETAKVATAAVPTDRLYSRVGTQAWDQQLGQKVIFMAAGGEQSATMELNPPDLGPLQVVLSVNKDQATASFTSAAPEVRQALENAMPKLREMMGEAGIQLGNATVSAGTPDQNNSFNQQTASTHSGGGQRGGMRGGAGDNDTSVEASRGTATVRRMADGAVDTFA